MKKKQLLGLILAGLLFAGASPAGATLVTSFTGPYSATSGNWSVWNSDTSNPGSYVVGTTSLTIYASANSVPTDIIVTLNVTQNSTFNFTYLLNQNGASSTPLAYYYINGGTQQPYVGGTNNIVVSAGQTISFELSSSATTSGKNPASFELDLTGVPEAGTWLAGAFLLGLVGLRVCRRNAVS